MLNSFKKVNKFKIASILTSLLYFFLFISFFLFPEDLCKDVGLTGSEPANFLVRRASMLMLGFAVITFLTRNMQASKMRQAISFSVGLNMLGFAFTEVFEMIRGYDYSAFIGPMVIEILVAIVFFTICISDWRKLKESKTEYSFEEK